MKNRENVLVRFVLFLVMNTLSVPLYSQCNPKLTVIVCEEREVIDSVKVEYVQNFFKNKKDKVDFFVIDTPNDICYKLLFHWINIRRKTKFTVYRGGEQKIFFLSRFKTVPAKTVTEVDYKACQIVSYKVNGKKIKCRRPTQTIVLGGGPN